MSCSISPLPNIDYCSPKNPKSHTAIQISKYETEGFNAFVYLGLKNNLHTFKQVNPESVITINLSPVELVIGEKYYVKFIN